MAQYIEKSALVAEIERRRKEIPKNETNKTLKAVYGNEAFVLTELLSLLDTLEVKEVKESSAADRGMAEEIIVNLKRIEQDYLIDLTKEMEWVRSKVQKGE